MPVRSSVCTYSPSAAISTSKYSSLLPTSSSLSVGSYKPICTPGSPVGNVRRKASVLSVERPSSSLGSPTKLAPNRYSLSSSSFSSLKSSTSSTFSPTISASMTNSTSGQYRPLSSAHSSFNKGRFGTDRLNSPSASPSSSSTTSSTSSSSSAYSKYSSLGSSYSNSSLLDRSSTDLFGSSGYSSSSYASARRRFSAASLQELPEGVPRGLTNLGNTCYMNSVIEALFSIDSFRNLILRASYGKPLTSELSALFKDMKSSTSPVSPASFKNQFSRNQPKFSGLGQQDAQEFLRYLINTIHEEANEASRRPRRSTAPQPPKTADEAWAQYRQIVDDSPLVDIVVGQLCSTITCSICSNKSYCWDPFWDLSLPLARGRYSCDLNQVVQDFTAKETLDSDERPICSKCKVATKSTKQIKLSRLPRVIILHLKKFSNDGYKLTSQEIKIDKTLVFNDTMNYQLQACISHHGHSSSSGHYTSHCEYSSKWFHFNDDSVSNQSVNETSNNKTKFIHSLWELKHFFTRFICFNLNSDSSETFKRSYELCGTSLSDILVVCGGIITLTGCFIAFMGLFPRNQTYIRLFLEGVGCLMVSVGVLIMIASFKIQAKVNRDRGADTLRNHELRRLNFANLAQDDGGNEFDLTFDSCEYFWHGIPNNCDDVNAFRISIISSWPIFHNLSRFHEIDGNNSNDHINISNSNGSNSIHNNNSNKDNYNGDNNEATLASAPSLKLDEFKLDTDGIDSNNWTPDSSYGSDHKAAIEAALSTVLTVSTLAGFRSNQLAQYQCCLEHAIQQKLSVKKWIKRLKVSKRSRVQIIRTTKLSKLETLRENSRQASIVNNN